MIKQCPEKPAEAVVHDKILSIDELAVHAQECREVGKTVVLCHGAFDLLHPGHIRHLQAAKQMGDSLFVTITEDRFIRKGPGRPAFNERMRAEAMAALEAVDFVATAPWPTAVEVIEKLQPHLYVKGSDYRDASKDVTGAIAEEKRAVEKHNGELVFTDEVRFSSTKLLNDFFGCLTTEQKTYLDQFKTEFTGDDVLAQLDALRSKKVLIIGEAIIDEYHYCTPDAMSNKSPTVSARFEDAEVFAGGVVAVGNCIAGLCSEIDILACVGDDQASKGFIASHSAKGVRVHFMSRPDVSTVRKRRFVHRFLNQKLFEVTFLNDEPICDETQHQFAESVRELVPQADAVIVVDFGHGFLTPSVIESITDSAGFLAVNAQINSSNRGFNSVRKYRGANYISVDEHEIRLPFGDRYGNLEDLIKRLSDETGCSNINVTLGSNGALYFDGKQFHRAPVFTSRIVDAIGAGDAFLSATSLLVQAGAPPAMIPFVGNCMGGLMAQIVGHRTAVDATDLYKFIGTLLK